MSTSNKVRHVAGVPRRRGGSTGRQLFHETNWKSRRLSMQFLRQRPSQLEWNDSDQEAAPRNLPRARLRAARRRGGRPLLRRARSAGRRRFRPAGADQPRRLRAPSFLDDANEGMDEVEDEGAIEAAIGEDAAPSKPAEVKEVPAAAANAVVQHAKHPEGLSLLRKARLEGKGDQRAYVAELPSGRKAKLTVNPRLQEQMQKLFALYKPQQGAMVAKIGR